MSNQSKDINEFADFGKSKHFNDTEKVDMNTNTPDKRVEELKEWALGVQQGGDLAEREFVANQIVDKFTQHHQDLIDEIVEKLEGMKQECRHEKHEDHWTHCGYCGQRKGLDQAIALVEEVYKSE